MSVQDSRKNIKISQETYDLLAPDKGDESWDEYLESLHSDSTIVVERQGISDGQIETIVDRTAEEVVRRVRNFL